MVSLLLAFPPVVYMHSFLILRALCPAYLILLDLIFIIIPGEMHKCEVPHYVVSAKFLSRLSSVQIPSSAYYSQTLSVVPTLISETKFPSHREPKAKL
jgi:hypothetical protein